ncbi:MAG: dihydrodipicolinate synthase family protein [Devosia sp.]|nr:dihydrodipicolinate synthase family protein [Devosia sp.]
MNRTLSGVIAAVPTPIDAAGEPDVERFLAHARWALANGCDGLNVLGTTGEATSFSSRQRAGVMRAAADGLDRARLMVGTGTPDLETTIALTRLAAELGFAGALLLPPYYYKGVPEEGLLGWFNAVVEATRATPIDLYLYNFPQMTGVPYTPALVRRLVSAFGNRIVGAKDSSGDLAYAAELAKIASFRVFPSNETALGRARLDGFAGCISATVNISAREAAALWADPADAAMAERVRYLRTAISAEPLVPGVKYLLSRRFRDPDWRRTALPWTTLSAEQQTRLDAIDITID